MKASICFLAWLEKINKNPTVFIPLTFLTKNGMGLVKISLLIGIGLWTKGNKRGKWRNSDKGENGQTYFFFKFYFDMKLIVFCTIFFRNFCFIGFLYTELLILTRNALMSEPKPCNWTTLDYPSDPCALFRLTALTFAQENVFSVSCGVQWLQSTFKVVWAKS